MVALGQLTVGVGGLRIKGEESSRWQSGFNGDGSPNGKCVQNLVESCT